MQDHERGFFSPFLIRGQELLPKGENVSVFDKGELPAECDRSIVTFRVRDDSAQCVYKDSNVL